MIWATRSRSQLALGPSSGTSSTSSVSCSARRGWNSPGHGARELGEVHRLRVQLDRAGVEPREVEQVHRQLLQPRDLLAHRLEELAPRVLVEVLVLEQLDEAAQREDRRAQLVRGGGDELLARDVDLPQLLLHLVERVRELADLVLGRHRAAGR